MNHTVRWSTRHLCRDKRRLNRLDLSLDKSLTLSLECQCLLIDKMRKLILPRLKIAFKYRITSFSNAKI